MAGEQSVPSSDIMRRFNALSLHDGCLMSIAAQRRGDDSADDVRLGVSLLAPDESGAWESFNLTFTDCASLSLDVDFWDKRMCADAISDNICSADPGRIARLRRDEHRAQTQRVEDLLLFSIVLCPTSGDILVLARDFIFERVDAPD